MKEKLELSDEVLPSWITILCLKTTCIQNLIETQLHKRRKFCSPRRKPWESSAIETQAA